MGVSSFNTGSYFTQPGAAQNQQNSWQSALQKNQLGLGYAGLANQLQQIGAQGQNALALQKQQGATAQSIANTEQAGQTQRTGMETASAQAISAGQNTSQQQIASMQDAGLTKREQMAVQGQLDVANLTTAEQERVGKYQADQQLAGQQYVANSTAQTAAAALAAQTSRFNTLLPMLQGMQSAAGGNGSSNITADLSALGAGAPSVTPSPVYTPAQIQQQVNKTRAQTDTGTASQTKNMQQDLAGRGFGSQSPLAKLLGAAYQGQGLAANTGAENDIRFNAANANAQNVLAGQGLQNQQYQGQLQAYSQLQQNKTSQQNALISALASLAG